MVTLKTRFDGRTIQTPPELRDAQPGEVLVVVQESMLPGMPRRPSVWEFFGIASKQRSTEEINAQVNADREQWDQR